MNIKTIDRSQDISQPVADLSDAEQLKFNSNYLRGSISQGIENRVSGSLVHDDTLLTKFHGIYQQDDRDHRSARQLRKLEPNYKFMVRMRIPGGVLNADQWNEVDRLSRLYASSGIRITTRQTVQLHGISKWHLRPLLKGLKKVDIDTIAACGDDSRGVVCGVDPNSSGIEKQVYDISKKTSERLIPKTTAYSEIWYEGENADQTQQEDPLYGKMYLPRKFKVGYAVPPVNDIDVFGQDVGLIAIVENNTLVGFNVCVGGGMGKIDSREDSYPRLATPIGYIEYQDAELISEIIMTIQRDYGDRKDRHRARFKYTIDRLGLDTFKQLLTERYGKELAPLRPYTFTQNGDQLGWHKSDDNKWHVTIYVESGRVNFELRDQLQALFQQFSGRIRLTTNQNLQLTQINDYEVKDVADRLLHLGLEDRLAPLSQHAHTLSCVALPTCGLAMAEAERYTRPFLEVFEQLKATFSIQDIPINLRITGCPNGCARPYLAEVALTGRAPGLYNLYLGGSHRGDRLATLYESNLDETAIMNTLAPLFDLFSKEKLRNEFFGDFLFRNQLIKVDSPNRRSNHIFQEL